MVRMRYAHLFEESIWQPAAAWAQESATTATPGSRQHKETTWRTDKEIGGEKAHKDQNDGRPVNEKVRRVE